MDDNEYYSMMRRQYSNPIKIKKNDGAKQKLSFQTPGSFSEWNNKYGHEDAEMFLERNQETECDLEKD